MSLVNQLQQYEETNLKIYSSSEQGKLVISSEEAKDFQSSLRHTIENLKNPYVDFFHWCKGELYDIRAMKEAMMTRDNLEQQKLRMITSQKSQQRNLQSLQDGKKNVNTLFKNQNDVTHLSNRLDQNDKLIKDLASLKDIISIYLVERFIPVFKKEKSLMYKRMISQFSVIEKNNSQ